MRVKLLSFFLLIGYSSISSAELMYSDYVRFKKGDSAKLMTSYIDSMGSAFSTANADLEAKGQWKLYCKDSKSPFSKASYQELLDMQIGFVRESNPAYLSEPKLPISMLLLQALQGAFPCKK